MSTEPVPSRLPSSAAWPAGSPTPPVAAHEAPASIGPLLEATVRQTEEGWGRVSNLCDRFLAESAPASALALWLREGHRVPGSLSKPALLRLLGRDIAELDVLLTTQVNAIVQHPRFQQIEASWLGLRQLTETVDDSTQIKIRVLNLPWTELARDIDRAIEFDQSQLFRKVYTSEFDMPGGEPYGLLIGDYYLHHHPAELAALAGVGQVAAAAFAPFITGADPRIFGLDSFTQLERPVNLSKVFEQTEYIKWRALRDAEDTRFLGLTLPRVLMRRPRAADGSRVDGFCYEEGVDLPSRGQYLWGNAAYAFAGVVMRAYQETGWLAEIRGARQSGAGGIVSGFPVHSFSTDTEGTVPRASTEVQITESQEKELSDLGFMPLSHCQDTEWAVFYSNPSLQRPTRYDDPAATSNARLSSMLQYLLCVSRFAHYLKVLTRDKLGALTEAADLEKFLHRWLVNYVTPDVDASDETRAERPLREASVQIREKPGRPGAYTCVIRLSPHYQLDELVGGVRLVTELSPGSRAG